MERIELTENQRCVLTLLQKMGPLSKGDLAERGAMGWATAVKVISQLSEQGMVDRLGTVRGDPRKKGKRAYLYGLSHDLPLAIGVDVEYRTTSMVLTNLHGDILAHATTATIAPSSDTEVWRFLAETIGSFLRDHCEGRAVHGVGIGVPMIGFLSHSQVDNLRSMRDLEITLSAQLALPVSVRDNTKSYALFEQWRNSSFESDDFIFVSIRTGIGTGVFYHGELYLGGTGLPGEIGHIQTVDSGGLPCRCGKQGCMETVVGQRNLYRAYCQEVLHDEALAQQSEQAGQEVLSEALFDLFRRARTGETGSRKIVCRAADHLGRSLASAILVLDISNIIISGHFGDDGVLIEDLLRTNLSAKLLRGSSFSVRYVPFDHLGHVRGAALLVLKDFLIDIRSNHEHG